MRQFSDEVPQFLDDSGGTGTDMAGHHGAGHSSSASDSAQSQDGGNDDEETVQAVQALAAYVLKDTTVSPAYKGGTSPLGRYKPAPGTPSARKANRLVAAAAARRVRNEQTGSPHGSAHSSPRDRSRSPSSSSPRARHSARTRPGSPARLRSTSSSPRARQGARTRPGSPARLRSTSSSPRARQSARTRPGSPARLQSG